MSPSVHKHPEQGLRQRKKTDAITEIGDSDEDQESTTWMDTMSIQYYRLIVPPPPADEFLIEECKENKIVNVATRLLGGGSKQRTTTPNSTPMSGLNSGPNSKTASMYPPVPGSGASAADDDHYSSSHLKMTPRGITKIGSSCVFYWRFFRPINNLIHGYKGFKSPYAELPFLIFGSILNPCFIWIIILTVYVIFDTSLYSSHYNLRKIQDKLHINLFGIDQNGNPTTDENGNPMGIAGRYSPSHYAHAVMGNHTVNRIDYAVNYIVHGYYVLWYLISVVLVLIMTEGFKKTASSTRPPYDWYVGFSPESIGTANDSNRKLKDLLLKGSTASRISKYKAEDSLKAAEDMNSVDSANNLNDLEENPGQKRDGTIQDPAVTLMSTTDPAGYSSTASSSENDLRKISKTSAEKHRKIHIQDEYNSKEDSGGQGSYGSTYGREGDLIWKRHFFFPNKFKSKYSFPSGDAAQAANVAAFMYLYGGFVSPLLLLMPGVAFARVFYVCHWVEDVLWGCFLGCLSQIIMYCSAFP